ncbi:c-type cytochrome, partial [Yoonia sp.]|uniref:c-type cytochrome n=1 Tax=Yoonia sp. TaxID=2212373 RepID=UPI003F6AD363
MRLLGLIMLLGLAGPVAAQDAVRGEAIYRFYCATCHGVSAEGNGPMSPSLVVQPTDLTQLEAGNGGVFPTTRVVMRIDGRDPLV